MHPVLFEIPGTDFPIRSFGVFVALGFLLAVWLWGKVLARHGADPENDPDRASNVGAWILVGVVGGARLFYGAVETVRYVTADKTPAIERYLEADDRGRAIGSLLAEAETDEERRAIQVELDEARRIAVGYAFTRDPLELLYIWKGGLVMYGGFFGAILLGVYAARKNGLHPWNALDTGLVCAFVGQSLGRWSCLLVGDDYGSIVPEGKEGLPFPLTITVPSSEWLANNPESLFAPELAGEVLWATQVWMSLNALLVAAVGYLVLRRKPAPGVVTGVVFLLYGVTRFVIEMFRGDEVRGVWFDGAISTSQLIAIPGALFGLWLILRMRKRAA
jgi:phosphatidylglycerol:prolipoprotein diacylglycerol transferase